MTGQIYCWIGSSVSLGSSAVLGIQQPEQSGVADLQFLGRLRPGQNTLVKALQNPFKTLLETFPLRNPGPPDTLALTAGPVHTGLDPLPDWLQFELGQSRQQVQ